MELNMNEVKEKLRSEAEEWFEKNNKKYNFSHSHYEDLPLYWKGVPIKEDKEDHSVKDAMIEYYIENKEVLLEALESLKQPHEDTIIKVNIPIIKWEKLKKCAEEMKKNKSAA